MTTTQSTVVNAIDIISLFTQTQSSIHHKLTTDIIIDLYNTPTLLIDNLGSENTLITNLDTYIQPIASIIKHRQALRLTTILVTNLTTRELLQKYDPKIYKQLYRELTILTFNHPMF